MLQNLNLVVKLHRLLLILQPSHVLLRKHLDLHLLDQQFERLFLLHRNHIQLLLHQLQQQLLASRLLPLPLVEDQVELRTQELGHGTSRSRQAAAHPYELLSGFDDGILESFHGVS